MTDEQNLQKVNQIMNLLTTGRFKDKDLGVKLDSMKWLNSLKEMLERSIEAKEGLNGNHN